MLLLAFSDFLSRSFLCLWSAFCVFVHSLLREFRSALSALLLSWMVGVGGRVGIGLVSL